MKRSESNELPGADPASLWDESARAPGILAGSGVTDGNTQRPAGLVDLYLALLDRCGLPANSANEGRSLRPLMGDPNSVECHRGGLTTYGRDNCGIRDERYTRYEEGSD